MRGFCIGLSNQISGSKCALILGNTRRQIIWNQILVSHSELIYVLYFPEDLIIIYDKID
jgi:hypothetical protein